ncbi:MAG TPA: CAP domain-containing protein [Anaerolineales bacterium]
MSRRALSVTSAVILVGLSVLGSTFPSQAASAMRPVLAGSPYDLVNAVNALRASFGLPLYSISPILMSTAQAQADFLAATGTMTHAGPGGIGLTDRLLAAGYPLAGDLSLGGFRAENITGGDESMPAEAAVARWTGDALHLNTMVSPDLTEIGAGVAISNGRVYYVIDAARPTTAEERSEGILEIAPVIVPITVSTPNAEGHVIHEVKPGQTLWQIAITYETKIDEIKRLNNLFDNNIYPGTRLLIRTGVVLPTITLTLVPALAPTATIVPTETRSALRANVTPAAATVASRAVNNQSTVITVMIVIIALALLGGGIFTWLGSERKE